MKYTSFYLRVEFNLSLIMVLFFPDSSVFFSRRNFLTHGLLLCSRGQESIMANEFKYFSVGSHVEPGQKTTVLFL